MGAITSVKLEYPSEETKELVRCFWPDLDTFITDVNTARKTCSKYLNHRSCALVARLTCGRILPQEPKFAHPAPLVPKQDEKISLLERELLNLRQETARKDEAIAQQNGINQAQIRQLLNLYQNNHPPPHTDLSKTSPAPYTYKQQRQVEGKPNPEKLPSISKDPKKTYGKRKSKLKTPWLQNIRKIKELAARKLNKQKQPKPPPIRS